MKHYLGELSLRAKIGDREVWALLDSGAGLTAIDATTRAGESFVPAMEMNGVGATQKIRVGLGELDAFTVGDLAFRHLAVISVPIPALDGYGDRRPEIIVGYTLFLAGAVRVDYAKGELVVAKKLDGLVSRSATSVPFRVEDGKLVTTVRIDGVDAPMEIDTGNSSGVSFVKHWTDAHGMPGDRRSLTLSGKSGAGHEETKSTLFRIQTATLGPITYSDRIASISNPPGGGRLAGLLGNDMLARCAAVVFDVPGRAMYLEPPCDRPRPETLSGWALARRESPDHKGRPWVVDHVTPDGAAAIAGFAQGDRILDVGGVPAADLEKIQAKFEQKEGTVVPITFVRDGKTVKTKLTLKRMLAP
jgi:hypothetical protein